MFELTIIFVVISIVHVVVVYAKQNNLPTSTAIDITALQRKIEQAVLEEDITTLQSMLDDYPILAGNELPRSLLSFAIEKERINVIKFFYENRSKYAPDLDEYPPIFDRVSEACASGKKSIVKYFAEQKWFNDERTGNFRKLNCLRGAAMEGQKEFLTHIESSAGFDIDDTKPPATISLLQIKHTGSPTFPRKKRLLGFKTLLASGANPNLHNNKTSLLHIATKRGMVEEVRELLRYGADMYRLDADGLPAIVHAGIAGHAALFVEILKNKFNIYFKFLLNDEVMDLIEYIASYPPLPRDDSVNPSFSWLAEFQPHSPFITDLWNFKEDTADLSLAVNNKYAEDNVDTILSTLFLSVILLVVVYSVAKVCTKNQTIESETKSLSENNTDTIKKPPIDTKKEEVIYAVKPKNKQTKPRNKPKKELDPTPAEEKLTPEQEEQRKREAEEERITEEKLRKENERAEKEAQAEAKRIKEEASRQKQERAAQRAKEEKQKADKAQAEAARLKQQRLDEKQKQDEELKAKGKAALEKAERDKANRERKSFEQKTALAKQKATSAALRPTPTFAANHSTSKYSQEALKNAYKMAALYHATEDAKSPEYTRNLHIKHLALMYYIHRAYLAISLHEQHTRKTPFSIEADLSKNIRNMLMHRGAMDAKSDVVFRSAEKLCTILPKDLAELKKANSHQSALDEAHIQELFQLANVPPSKRQETFLRDTIQETPLYEEAKRQHDTQAISPTYATSEDYYDWIKNVMIPRINLFAHSILKTSNPDLPKWRQYFPQMLDALKMAITICGDLYNPEKTTDASMEEFLMDCRKTRNAVAHNFPDTSDATIIGICRKAIVINDEAANLTSSDFSYSISATLFGRTQPAANTQPTANAKAGVAATPHIP